MIALDIKHGKIVHGFSITERLMESVKIRSVSVLNSFKSVFKRFFSIGITSSIFSEIRDRD
jgi:hypothetical protein